ncbi:PAS domain-containing protein [Peptoniphilus duerdenii]|uniref:YheO-like protein n=1 Tax=Peptoniphilus duerdenii ATCC BAA-1640 TaxID=862517 RepID=E0NKW9_9FIRM|nr:PAS domain-containing protein [Peptoniphilus duerdenii]EFM25537.1 YheO-like protein [Peptoniphilus duerdenii ATCC BAA-1640]
MNTENRSNILKQYESIANFLATTLGKNVEIALLDYNEGKSKIIYLINGELSGRKIGDEYSGFSLRKILKTDYKTTDYVSNYIVMNEVSHRVFRASTFYIKDEGELIGMLNLHYDLTKFLEFRDFYENELLFGVDESKSEPKEFFTESIDLIVENMIKNVFIHWDRSVPTSKILDSANPIRQLYELGVFKFKGAINRVAELLDISNQTVYRYIKEIEESEK